MTTHTAKPTPATTDKRVAQHADDAKRQGLAQRELVERDRSTVRKTSNARGDQQKRAQK